MRLIACLLGFCISATAQSASGILADPRFKAMRNFLDTDHDLSVREPIELTEFPVGGPEWVRSDVYEVDAKASGNPLQSLLEDRFQLRIHCESRLMPVYALVPARGGLKLPSPRDESCVEAQAPPPGRGDPPPLPRCGGIDGRLGSGKHHIACGKVPMAEFVRKLSEVLGR
jgi:uncharacterized protein (TIGR03435 family)